MRGTSRLAAALLAFAAVSVAPFFVPSGPSAVAVPSALAAQQEGEDLGKVTYDRWCAGCHGVEGDGEGPGAATMLPRPRDFTRALYQIRTTGSGELPTDEDILHVIDVGMPGTAMPGWEEQLTRQERLALVDYLKTFSRFFEASEAPPPIDFGSAPRATEERIEEGREIYQETECWQCHGQAGRGDGTSAPTLEDDAGRPIYAVDLTKNWRFNGGGTVEDIYRRLRTGLDGTPMPTFQDMVDAGIITDDQLWSLAHYVRSLAPEEQPDVREVVVAERVEEGALPTGPTDEGWEGVERFWVPTVAQIIEPPRWFTPRVPGLWVQALHDGGELAMRVSWTDPSESPAPRWADFARAVEAMMEPDEDAGWAPGAPDRLVVQFPRQPSEGRERPYFLQGDARRPAYLWLWESDRGGREQIARGLGTGEDQESGSQTLQTEAAWEEGEWRVVFRRSLATPDTAGEPQLAGGRTLPVAFQVQDGDNAEADKRAAVSTWYFIHLREPTPVTAYVAPVIALILTGLLGLLAVRRAQALAREGGSGGTEASGALGSPAPAGAAGD